MSLARQDHGALAERAGVSVRDAEAMGSVR